MIIRTIFATSLLFLCAASSLSAEELGWAEKMFSTLNIDFGVVARGADTRHTVVVKNLYGEAAHISNVRTTCGCSAASPSTRSLASQQVAAIEVTMDTKKFIRRKDSNLIVTFDAPRYAEVRIPITAYIRTDVVLTPGAIQFGSIAFGEEPQQKIAVAYAGRNDWKIGAVKSSHPSLSGMVVETGRSNGRVNYDLIVSLSPKTPIGRFRHTLTLITDDEKNKQVPILVEGRVEADISISPEVVSFGRLIPGQDKTVQVVLRGRRPFLIEKIESETDLEAFKVQLPTEARKVHVLPLTVTPPDTPGPFKESFTVTIAGRTDVLTFKAFGRIAEPDAQ